MQPPEASLPYWEFCQRIQGIHIGDASITFHVVFKPEDAGRRVVVDGASQSFLRFFAKKVAKIDREREVTQRYLGPLSRRRIVVSVKPVAGVQGWKAPRTFTFQDGSCATKQAEQEAVESFVRMFSELERGAQASVASPTVGGRAPFVAGPPIQDPLGFFGRGSDIKRLFDLWKNVPLQNAAVIGPVRSGKTSLLLHLRALSTSPLEALRPDQLDQCPAAVRAHRWVFVDFQDARMGDPERLLRRLLSGLGLPAPEPCTSERFSEVVEDGLKTPAVVLLDEMGVALERYHDRLDNAFWEGLRALSLAVGGKLGFVLAAHDSPHVSWWDGSLRFSLPNVWGGHGPAWSGRCSVPQGDGARNGW